MIGGGVTGCSCALTLASNGVRVRLHEAREIAGGASGRNGGFALRGATVPYDRARAELGSGAGAAADGAHRTVARPHGGARRRRVPTGRQPAPRRRRRPSATRSAASTTPCATTASPSSGSTSCRRGSPALYDGAILHPGDGAIQPARWVRRLAAHAAAAGADLREHDPVTVDAVDADVVVVAGDGFTASLLPELAAVVRPTRGQVLVTEPLDELLYSRPHYARDGYDYWQQLPDGRLVIGGQRDASLATEDTDVEETTPVIQDRLEQLVAQLVGGTPRVTHRWAGIWGTTPDLMPLAGRVPGRDGIWLAGGYSGHGNALGLACGELVARAILGDPPPELDSSTRPGSRPRRRRPSSPRARAARGRGSRPRARARRARSRDPGSRGRSSRTP